MTITYQQVIDGARPTLNDGAKVRYPDAECLGYLNDGLLEMVIYRPDLFVQVGDIPLVGGPDQIAPAGATFIADIFSIKNGAGVSRTTIDVLRSFRPSWRIDPAGPCQNWGLLPQDPKFQRGPRFFVYPPSLLGQVLTGQWVQPPFAVVIGGINTSLPVPDQYSLPLQSYIIFRAESKDDEFAVDGRVPLFGQRFAQLLDEADKNEDAKP